MFSQRNQAQEQGINVKINVDPLPTRAIDDEMSYEARLFHHTNNSRRKEPHFLLFRGLQRLNILRLQNDIAKIKRAVWENDAAPATHPTKKETAAITEGEREEHKLDSRTDAEKLTLLVHQYTDAVRDYQYWSTLIPITGSQANTDRLNLEQAFEEVGNITKDAEGYGRFNDPLLLPSDPLRDVLKRLLPQRITYTKNEKLTKLDEYLTKKPPEEVSPFVDSLARFIVAVLGGAALVVPMLIMRLPRVTLTKSLVTTSIAVLLFAAALSIGFRASNTETVVATATYAAVLVVFVGTSS